MSRYKNLTVENKDGYRIITINRPKVLNALNAETLGEMEAEIDEIAKNPGIRALILTGCGEKSFAAGADINELQNLSPLDAENFSKRGQRIFNKIENLPIPVIAAVNGFALGGGCELALACDIRIAAQTCKLGLPEVNLGLIPGYGGTQRLTKLIGQAKALELILTGDIIGAEDALRVGLVNKITPLDQLMNETEQLAKKLSRKAPQAVKSIKEAVKGGFNLSIEDGCNLESGKFALLCASSDKNEGVSAFLEKRTPCFKGN